jgi:hypothetical protein
LSERLLNLLKNVLNFLQWKMRFWQGLMPVTEINRLNVRSLTNFKEGDNESESDLKENYRFPLSNAVGLHAEKGNGQWSSGFLL